MHPAGWFRSFAEAVVSGRWLTPDRAVAYARLSLALSAVVAIAWIALARDGIDLSGRAIGADFVNVYAAGRLVLEGRPEAAYDWSQLFAAQQALLPTGDFYSWHYPPAFLLLAAGLASLPYLAALALYVGSTLAAFVAAVVALSGVKPSQGSRADVIVLALGFPAVFVCAGHGQNGFLTAALLGWGLVFLDRRPIVSGLCFGLLAYKPQLAVILPLALAVGFHGRAFASAAVTVLVTQVVAFGAFGAAPFQGFLDILEPTRRLILEAGEPGLEKIQSVFGAVRLFGGNVALAGTLQAAATIGAAMAVAWVWWKSRDRADRAAALAFAVPLTTPYLIDYDLTVLGLGIAALAGKGRGQGFRPGEITVLAALWAWPILARPAAGLLALPLTPLLVAVALLLVFARVRSQTRSPASDHPAAPSASAWGR